MNDVIAAVTRGANRPTTVLPGEYGARFVRRLFDEASRAFSPDENQRFQWIRACVDCGIDAAAHNRLHEADTWTSVANGILAAQRETAYIVSLSCIKSAESYVEYARGDFRAAVACLDQADREDQRLPPDQFPVIRAQRLHYRHLHSRILLGQGDVRGAVKLLVDALGEASMLAGSGYQHPELLSYGCSRMAGELAIAAGSGLPLEEYLALTACLEQMHLEGTVSEYLLYRAGHAALRQRGDRSQLLALVDGGRMKTVCWYAAVADLGETIGASERKALLVLSSAWRDIPAVLRSRLLKLLD